MNSGNRVLVFFLIAGMDLCYLYSCANFLTTLIFSRPFPFLEAVGSFFLAALLTALAHGRGWRVIAVVGVQALGFFPTFWRMVTVFYSWSDSFVGLEWFTAALDRPSSAIAYFVILLLIAWALTFWAGGAVLATADKDYTGISQRFDRGLLVFFTIFLIRFYLNAVQDFRATDAISGWLILPFILFGLLAIGLVRNAGSAPRDFLPGFQRIGVLLGFGLVVLVSGAGLIMFFLPFLTLAAQEGSSVLGLVSRPFLSLLYLVLHWLFGDEILAPEGQPAEKEQLPGGDPTWTLPAWFELIARILTVVFGTLIALVLLGMILAFAYSIVIWLFSKTSKEKAKPSLRVVFLETLTNLGALMLGFARGVARQIRGHTGIIQLYGALQTWGRNSGAPPAKSETPYEYGSRLGLLFPMLKSDIEKLVNTFNQNAYGEIALSDRQWADAQSAWQILVSPRHWPMRIRAWFHLPP